MLIKGELIYNHDLRDKRNKPFIYDGKQFQVTDNEEQADFDNRAVELEYNGIYKSNNQLKHFLKNLRKANGDIFIDNVEFTPAEMQKGLDYLRKTFPVSFEWSEASERTIKNYFPYEWDNGLIETMNTIEGYLNYNSLNQPFYSDNRIIEMLCFWLGNDISSYYEGYFYSDEKVPATVKEDLLQYLSECFKNNPRYPEFDNPLLCIDDWVIFEILGLDYEDYDNLELLIEQHRNKETEANKAS